MVQHLEVGKPHETAKSLWLRLGAGVVDQAALGLDLLEALETLPPEGRALRIGRLRQALHGVVLLGREILALAEAEEPAVTVTLEGALVQGLRWLQQVDGLWARPLELGPVPAVRIRVPPLAFARLLHCLVSALEGSARLEAAEQGPEIRLALLGTGRPATAPPDPTLLRPAAALAARWGGRVEVETRALALILPVARGEGEE